MYSTRRRVRSRYVSFFTVMRTRWGRAAGAEVRRPVHGVRAGALDRQHAARGRDALLRLAGGRQPLDHGLPDGSLLYASSALCGS